MLHSQIKCDSSQRQKKIEIKLGFFVYLMQSKEKKVKIYIHITSKKAVNSYMHYSLNKA